MVEIFKALSDESRLRILALLCESDMCVCEVESALEIKQSNASRHLSALKHGGLLESYKKAQWVYYKLNRDFVSNNQNLWLYLEEKIRRLPSFEEDKRRALLYRLKDSC